MFKKLILSGGSFYNVFDEGIFCKLLTQHCRVSTNAKLIGLVIAPYFPKFLVD